jgi:hypothetical protein
VLIGFLLRLWLLVVTDSHTTDGIGFLSTACYLRDSSNWIDVPKRITMPLYPILSLGMSYFTGNDIPLAGRWVNMLVGITMIPMVFTLARKLFDARVACFAALFTAVDFLLIEFSVSDRADLPFALLNVLLAYLFWVIPWEKCNYKHALLFGFSMGLTQLTRTIGILHFTVFAVFWIVYMVRNHVPWKRFLPGTLIPVFVIFGLLASLPPIYLSAIGATQQSYIGHSFIDGTLVAKGEREAGWLSLNEDSTDFAISEKIRNFKIIDAFDWDLIVMKYQFGFTSIMNHFGESMWEYFQSWLVFLMMFVLVFILRYKIIDGWDRVGYLLLLLTPILFLLPIVFTDPIFFLPFRPFFLVILGWLVSGIISLKELRNFGVIVVSILTIAIVTNNFLNLYPIREKEAGHINGYRLVGEYLREIQEPGDTVIARNRTVGFFAGMKGYPFPAALLKKTIKFCRHHEIDYFIYGPDERYARSAWASEILDMIKDGDKTFESIHVETRGGPIQVYKLHYDNETPLPID